MPDFWILPQNRTLRQNPWCWSVCVVWPWPSTPSSRMLTSGGWPKASPESGEEQGMRHMDLPCASRYDAARARPTQHGLVCPTTSSASRAWKWNKKVAIKHGFEGARERILPWNGWRVVRIGFPSWRTVRPLFSSCLALLGALDRNTQKPLCSASCTGSGI